MKDLMVLHDDNATFINHSIDSKNYLRDSYSVDFVAIEDKMYIGLYKPFNSFYIELKTPTIAAVNTFKIAGNVITIQDDTKSFTRSGFVSFEKPSDWNLETFNGIEAYWVELTSSADFTLEIQGLNLVFSDDNDLSQEVREIDKQLAKGDTSFIAYHLAARNEIVQTLRNGGLVKDSNGVITNLTHWDILDRGEIKQAAKYLALAKIFFDVSKNNDDKSYKRFRDYEAMFGKAFNLYIMHIDKDDDGIKDESQDLRINSIEIEIL